MAYPPAAGNLFLAYTQVSAASADLETRLAGLGGSGVIKGSAKLVQATYQALATDNLILGYTASGPFTITLPPGVVNAGQVIAITKTSASFDLSVAPSAGETIDNSATPIVLSAQGQSAIFQSHGTAQGGAGWKMIGQSLPGGLGRPFILKSAAYLVATGDWTGTDHLTIRANAAGGNFTITLPSVVMLATGARLTITKIGGTNTVTLAGAGAEIIHNANTQLLTGDAETITIAAEASQWYIVSRTVASGGGAPTTADYLVKTADATLSAERVVTDTASVTVDWATAGQAKFNAKAVDIVLTMTATPFTVTAADCATGQCTVLADIAGGTVNLPAVAAVAIGTRITLIKINGGAGSVVLDPAGAETVRGNLTEGVANIWETRTILNSGARWENVGSSA